jgi:hypothetical protein
MGLVVNEATFADNKLVVKIAAIKGEFTGTLSGKTLAGEWVQAGGAFRQQVTFAKQ